MISFTTVAIFEFVHVLVFLLIGDVLFMNEPKLHIAYYIVMGLYIVLLGFLSIINRGEKPDLCPLESIAKLDQALFDFSKNHTVMYITIYLIMFGSLFAAGKYVIHAAGLYFPA